MGILENRQKLIGNPLRISGLKEFQEEEVASFFKKTLKNVVLFFLKRARDSWSWDWQVTLAFKKKSFCNRREVIALSRFRSGGQAMASSVKRSCRYWLPAISRCNNAERLFSYLQQLPTKKEKKKKSGLGIKRRRECSGRSSAERTALARKRTLIYQLRGE